MIPVPPRIRKILLWERDKISHLKLFSCISMGEGAPGACQNHAGDNIMDVMAMYFLCWQPPTLCCVVGGF